MNTASHPVAPEEVMAFLDGELASAEADAVSAHLDQCAECAHLAAQFRGMSLSLSEWTVPTVPSSLEESVISHAARAAANQKHDKPGHSNQLSFWNWRLWAVGGAVATLLLVVGLSNSFRTRHEMVFVEPGMPMAARPQATRQPLDVEGYSDSPTEPRGMDGLVAPSAPAPSTPVAKAVSGIAGSADARAFSASTPMIARTVSLSIVVKDFATARVSLDSILARHRGYAAQLTAATAEHAPRSLQASLRIPAPELASVLAELKSLGRVGNESQSGEEVTQQHTDLVARLQNSRETEERLRAILQQRTGKIEDVLQVEEEIARVRGEIESMEAEQQALEHRVDFATIDLQLTEEYKAELNSPSASVSNRIHNAFVAGLRNAAETILGIVLFFEESGPVLLIWLAILGVPVSLLWRRYRRMQAKL
jgi:anti-sigma factor RsiW